MVVKAGRLFRSVSLRSTSGAFKNGGFDYREVLARMFRQTLAQSLPCSLWTSHFNVYSARLERQPSRYPLASS